MKLKDILEQLKSDIELNLPPLLAAEGLENFSIYHIGTGLDATTLGFFIYQDYKKNTQEENLIAIIFQMQLNEKDEIESATYQDVFEDYLKNYDPYKIKMDILDSIEFDSWPIEKGVTNFVFALAEWRALNDSCSGD